MKNSRSAARASWLWALLMISTVALGSAQTSPLPHHVVEMPMDSGVIPAPEVGPTVVFSEEIRVEGAIWLRLFFAEAELGRGKGRPSATLRMTSLLDGATQHHTPKTVKQWQLSSAYFNGDAVRIELIAEAGAPASRVRLDRVTVGEPGPESICGTTDDRVLSNNPRSARLTPIGCSGWIINDQHKCFLTAGHCLSGSNVAQFNVPLSNANGTINHPPPEDQYAVDIASRQGTGSGVGNDWGYLGYFPNTETGLTPYQAQGSVAYDLADPPATPAGETINITGYGTVSGTQGTPLTWNQVQKEHTGLLVGSGGNSLQYAVDTTGGNSGSAVFNETTGFAIGIHTHAGCFSGGGANNGTSMLNSGLVNALANPTGICLNGPDIDFLFEDDFETGDTLDWSATVG